MRPFQPPTPLHQWLTGQEKDNLGFIIFRKRVDDVGGGEFEEVASFENFPPLNSRGCARVCVHVCLWCVYVCVREKACGYLPVYVSRCQGKEGPSGTDSTAFLTNRGEGGFYNFIDEGVPPGNYLYRVTDQDRCVSNQPYISACMHP